MYNEYRDVTFYVLLSQLCDCFVIIICFLVYFSERCENLWSTVQERYQLHPVDSSRQISILWLLFFFKTRHSFDHNLEWASLCRARKKHKKKKREEFSPLKVNKQKFLTKFQIPHPLFWLQCLFLLMQTKVRHEHELLFLHCGVHHHSAASDEEEEEEECSPGPVFWLNWLMFDCLVIASRRPLLNPLSSKQIFVIRQVPGS